MNTSCFLRPLLAAAISAGCAAANAMPAKRTVTHAPDGKGGTVAVRMIGDENFHYFVNADDGTLLTRDGDAFVPADIAPDGEIRAYGTPVKASLRKGALAARRAKAPNKVAGMVEGTTFPARGEQRAVVILAQYQDIKFNLSDPLDYFTRMLNQEGFSDYRATGSARDWFIHSSNGIFRPTFDVYGPVTLQKNREFYGGNDAFDQDNAPQKMAIEGCRQLNPEVDFSRYDCDGDGVIDNVFVVYAGRGEASGGPADSVWPHAWKITSAEPGTSYTFDGVKLDRYACVNEWELSDQGYGYRPVGIGSFIHEFSHVMGLPDLYSTKYAEGTFTAGAWSAMDYGPYNNDCCTPPQYSAWERSALGYFEPEQLQGKGNIALKPLEQGDAYVIPTEKENEFFIIENRQQSGWDSYIPGHGMLVWHIDYDSEIWRTNALNNDPAHNRVDIIEADGTRDEKSRGGDCFPGEAGVTALGASTSPALISWAGADTGISLTDITERRDGTIAFRLNGGASDIESPSSLTATDILAGGFTARWQVVEGAKGYTVYLYGPSAEGGQGLIERYETGTDNLLKINGLTPSTDYSFTVTADDGFFGSAESEPATLRTLDPTFDYFAPVAIDAAEVGEDSFTAAWEAMTDATDYLIDVYEKVNEPGIPVTATFDTGAEDLPAGWSTTASGSYGMASYAGAAPMSLRLSADGDRLESADYPDGIRALSFWHRGNSTSDAETVSVLAFDGDEWEETAAKPVVSAKGGVVKDFTFGTDTRRIAIRFNRPAKGSLALDDVTVEPFGPLRDTFAEGYEERSTGNVTRLQVTGLKPATTYYYSLVADNGSLRSLRSNVVEVTTGKRSAVSLVKPDSADYSVKGSAVTLGPGATVTDIAGRTVATGPAETILPAGVYIISAPGKTPVKILTH